MGGLNRLAGKSVALDTAPLIYFVEENPHFLIQVRPFFAALAQGEFMAFTSTLTITEALVKPLQLGLLERAHTFNTKLAIRLKSCKDYSNTPSLWAFRLCRSHSKKFVPYKLRKFLRFDS